MKILLTFCFALLTCATLHAQSVIVKGTGAGDVHRSGTGAGSVRGVAIPPLTYTNFCSGRFTVWNTNQDVVVDTESGLTWMRNASAGGSMDWTNAVDYCDNLSTNGHEDWRMPSIAEFSRDTTYFSTTNGLVDAYDITNSIALPFGHPFTSVQPSGYWVSTVVDAGNAWFVHLNNGAVSIEPKISALYIWPVRGP